MVKTQFGIIGLGIMGQNLALNLDENGYTVSVYNRTSKRTNAFMQKVPNNPGIVATYTLDSFVNTLVKPRKILLMVKAGPPVDRVIAQLKPLLTKEDILIDGGNSFYRDTERRSIALETEGFHYLGMGISGGEEGARYGPSIMPGGTREAYTLIEPMLQDIAAKSQDNSPCVAYIGPRGAGHYVKMIHNAIEYADMQLICESYAILQTTIHPTAQELSQIFDNWNQGELNSYLIEITAKIFTRIDTDTGNPLIEMILDKAGQKGTGKWACQDALDLGYPIPSITAAVEARNLSSLKEERVIAAKILPKSESIFNEEPQIIIDAVQAALYASKVCAYAQGLALLTKASKEYEYDLNLAEIARIWRAGCIIRAQLLEDITQAYLQNPDVPNLLIINPFKELLQSRYEKWRYVVKTAFDLDIAIPAMSASLAYYNAYRTNRLPTHLIQAQRDYFGAHTFERVDKPGSNHIDWISDP